MDTTIYKDFTLRKCWCGYPEKRWLIYWGWIWKGTAKTLKEAKEKVDEIRKKTGLNSLAPKTK